MKKATERDIKIAIDWCQGKINGVELMEKCPWVIYPPQVYQFVAHTLRSALSQDVSGSAIYRIIRTK